MVTGGQVLARCSSILITMVLFLSMIKIVVCSFYLQSVTDEGISLCDSVFVLESCEPFVFITLLIAFLIVFIALIVFDCNDCVVVIEHL